MSTCCLKAQDLTLKGRIISEDLEVLQEVRISNQNDDLRQRELKLNMVVIGQKIKSILL